MRIATSRAGFAIGLASALVLAGASCSRSSGGGSGSTTGTGSTGDATGGAATTYATPDACMSSDDCETSGHCIAPYDPGAQDDPAMRGPAACVDACIEQDDLQRWCLDDAACCGELRCNEVDGFCERNAPVETAGDGTASTGETETGTQGADGTASSSGTTEGTASSTSSGGSTSAGGSTSSGSSTSSGGSAT